MPESEPPRVVRWGIRIAAATAILIGVFWLVMWFLGLAPQWSSTMVTMKTNMALAQVLAGYSLLVLGTGKAGKAQRWVGALLSLIVLAIGALTLSEHLFRLDLGIDQLLAGEPPGALATASPNRMGPPGATSLTLIGAGLLALALGRRRIMPYLGLVVIVITLVPAVGYLYGISAFYAQPRLTGIAWPAVVALLALGVGLVLAQWDDGPVALLLRDDAGGQLLRRMLPVTVFVPLALGLLRTMAESRGLLDAPTGRGLLIVTLILIFSWILWRSATGLSLAAAEQHRVEQALRKSEQRYRELFETMQEALFLVEMITDEQGHPVDWRYLETNPQLDRYMGVPRGQLIGRTYSQAVPHPDPAWIEMVGKVAFTREPLSREVFAPTHRRWLQVNAFSPSPGQAAILFTDVTERKQAEEALLENEWFLEKAQEVAHIGSWISDPAQEGSLRWSREVYHIFGLSEGEFDGRVETFFSFIHPDDLQAAMEASREAIAGTRPYDLDHRIVRRDGTVRWVHEAADVLRDENGRPTKMVGVVQDITDRKRADERERRAEQEQIEFYRRTIAAATNGKLILCDPRQIENLAGPPVASWQVHTPAELHVVRDGVMAEARAMGMDERRAGRLIIATVEAMTNSIKHAGGGQASIHRVDDALMFVVSDRGPGIPALTVPDVALRQRFSTVGTFGAGYKIIVAFGDKVYLATGAEGTTVGIRMEIHPAESGAPEVLTAGQKVSS